MPITSLILNVAPEKKGLLKENIERLPFAEVHHVLERAIIVTTDTQTMGEDRKATEALRELPDVITAGVVYSSTEADVQ